jgi:hypothetical protein
MREVTSVRQRSKDGAREVMCMGHRYAVADKNGNNSGDQPGQGLKVLG